MNAEKKRIAIFAAYEGKEFVQDYVVIYLEFLRKVADYIVVVYDNSLSHEEVNKLTPYADHIIAQRHGEYDFGSYKRGYQYAADENILQNFDELILCNDSCFCYDDITPCFDKMAGRDYDFWGMTECEIFSKHLQSWFLVLTKKVFLSDIFKSFILSIEKKDNYMDIVKSYEVALTGILASEGFNYGSVNGKFFQENPTIYPVYLWGNGVFLIKKKCFSNYLILKISFIDALQLDKILQKNKEIYEAVKKCIGIKKSIFRLIVWNKIKFFFFEKTHSDFGFYKIKIFRVQIWKGKV